jgi:hypothetical protein
VKSDASTVLGRHWGWKVDKARTGPPIRVGDRKKVTASWEFSLPCFTRALVRRKLLGNDKYVSGIEAGTEVFKGTGRLDTRSYSVTIG